MLKPQLWQEINSECDDDEFITTILTVLKIHFLMCDGSKSIQDICKEKVRDVLDEADEVINKINGCSMREALQIGRENALFPIDSQGDIISFVSWKWSEFHVFRQISEGIARVDKTWKILELDTPDIEIIREGESRSELLYKLEELKLFIKIHQAFHWSISEKVSFTRDELNKYWDFVELWFDSQDDFIPVNGEDIFEQEGWKWKKKFMSFLEEGIHILERKTFRAQLEVVK